MTSFLQKHPAGPDIIGDYAGDDATGGFCPISFFFATTSDVVLYASVLAPIAATVAPILLNSLCAAADGFEGAGHSTRATKLLAGLCIGDLCAEGEQKGEEEANATSSGDRGIEIKMNLTAHPHESLSIDVEPERWIEDEDDSETRQQSGSSGGGGWLGRQPRFPPPRTLSPFGNARSHPLHIH